MSDTRKGGGAGGDDGPSSGQAAPHRSKSDEPEPRAVLLEAVNEDVVDEEVTGGALISTATPSESRLELIIARVGRELIALPVAGVEEIIEVSELRPAPEADEMLVGLCHYDGRLLPVYRPGPVLGAAVSQEAVSLVLVLRTGTRRVGVAVDDAEDVVAVKPASVRRPVRGADERIVRGMVLHEGRLLSLLDIEAFAVTFSATQGGGADNV